MIENKKDETTDNQAVYAHNINTLISAHYPKVNALNQKTKDLIIAQLL